MIGGQLGVVVVWLFVWKNDFIALRHGKSIANEQHLIVSRPPWALSPHFGLSEVGKVQASCVTIPPLPLLGHTYTTSTSSSSNQNHRNINTHSNDDRVRPVVLITSDFARAVQTAEIVQHSLIKAIPARTVTLHLEERLRERDFGRWDLTNDSNYQRVWDKDVASNNFWKDPKSKNDDDKNIDNCNFDDDGVESVHSVLKRSRQCMEDWDKVYTDCWIVLVAHGDVLQILQTSLVEEGQLAPHQHRSLPHLETAVPRLLVRQGQPKDATDNNALVG